MLIAKDIKQNAAGKTESDTEEKGGKLSTPSITFNDI
jgi:hypothetical protein